MKFVLSACAALAVTATASVSPDQAIVNAHVEASANQTFRDASGDLKFPYLVPSGPYNQLWDWDSMFTGVALLEYGSQEYFAGSMLNFLHATNLSTGEVQGCQVPSGPTGTISHAKPVVIQGSWIATKHGGNETLEQFKPYRAQMKAQLNYWIRERRQNETGLYVWYDQLESGQDNLVLSTCPSSRSPECWNETLHAKAISSVDLMSFLYREFVSYEKFNAAWAETARADSARDKHLVEDLLAEAVWAHDEAENVRSAVNEHLWVAEDDVYTAANLTKAAAGFQRVTNTVGLTGFALFAGMASENQSAALRDTLLTEPLFSSFGVRSTGSDDPRYSNANMIKPYSNWRGPIWVNENVVISYGLMEYGYVDQAKEVAERVLAVLADDLRDNNTWHEGYSSETGVGLAAPGFLSWNTLAANWMTNLDANHNPLAL